MSYPKCIIDPEKWEKRQKYVNELEIIETCAYTRITGKICWLDKKQKFPNVACLKEDCFYCDCYIKE